jgi:phosphopantetheine--protein transferase-like protein
MDEKIRSIVASYTKLVPENITAETRIDRTALGSSIHVHRFFAALAQAGYPVSNYQTVSTVAQLLQQINGTELQQTASNTVSPITTEVTQHGTEPLAGIDIENIASMPQTDDFREHNFYTSNFASSEIAYCILQSNPYASFAGLFAAKEALVKANNSLRNQQFNQLVFKHTEEGKPGYPGYAVSVSHTDTTAVAVVVAAVQNNNNHFANDSTAVTAKSSGPGLNRIISLLALVLSIAAIILYFRK